MLSTLSDYLVKPALHTPSTAKFWDDEHISKGMLEAHLHSDWDAASRNDTFINESVNWISTLVPSNEYPALLDLGCGPGLYAEKFNNAGYSVTGIDFSLRSVTYAQEQAILKGSDIEYHYQNYLNIDYSECFDLVTLIYCDYGVLSTNERLLLLAKIFRALKPNGKFIVDVFTPAQHASKKEKKDWEYQPTGGFWDEKPHFCLNSFYRYDEDHTVLNQTIVVNDRSVNSYNIWEHCFTEHTLIDELKNVGFRQVELYGDVAGKEYSKEGAIICAVLTK